MARVLVFLMGLTLFFASFTEAEYMKYKDPKQPLGMRIKDLIKRMTLEEKIGQMTQIERKVASADVMRKYFIGSVLSGGGSVPAPKASAQTWINMVNEFQKGAMSTRLGIPMIYGIDAVHGHNNVYNATIFPHNVGLGATRDPELVKRIGAATALEVRATGIQYAFAPCIAVCRDPRWGRCYESYSEDVKIVQEMTELVPGLQGDIPPNATKGVPYVAPGKTKVAACAKHFVGDGGTTDGINENNTVISTKGLLKIHMPGYYNSIIKRVSTVMMYANREWINVFLKDTLNFRGIVISDWEASDRITSPPGANYTYSIQASISAGLDMIMVQMDYQRFIDGLTFVKNKFIPMSRIDNVVKRILPVKFVVGLFENPFADNGLVVMIGREEHTELIWEAARKSLALLKDRDREAVWKSLALLKGREREAVWKSLLLLKDREAVWKSLLLKNGEEADEPLLPLSKKAPRVLVEGSHAHIFIFFISRRRFFYLVHLSILLILPVFLLLIFYLARSFSDLFVP